jgi:hypothetical protein
MWMNNMHGRVLKLVVILHGLKLRLPSLLYLLQKAWIWIIPFFKEMLLMSLIQSRIPQSPLIGQSHQSLKTSTESLYLGKHLGPAIELLLISSIIENINWITLSWGTLRFRHGTFVDFDKVYMFCDKCCVHINKCVFIVIKIKCVNSGRICDKVNFTTKLHTFYNTLAGIYQNTHNNLSGYTQIL